MTRLSLSGARPNQRLRCIHLLITGRCRIGTITCATIKHKARPRTSAMSVTLTRTKRAHMGLTDRVLFRFSICPSWHANVAWKRRHAPATPTIVAL